MLTSVMDFDPRITSDGSGYGSGHGWHCNFHFGYEHDIIDEHVENERSCMQVLQLLTAKADAEIHDLEDELAILQCQLNWAESDHQKDRYELFCAVFKRKINFLTSSIERLRNRDGSSGHKMDATLELQRPAERICDIIYALIKPDFLEFNDKVSTSEGNSESDASQHGESEKCMSKSKIGDADMSPVLAEKEVTVKVEDHYDVNVQLDAYNSLTKTENHQSKDPSKVHREAFEDHSGITCSRKKSSLSSILKPEGQKVRRKPQSNFGCVKRSISTLVFENMGNSESSSDADSSRQSGLTSKAQGRLHFPPATNNQVKLEIEEDMIYANPFQVKRQQRSRMQGAKSKSPKVKVSKGEPPTTRGREMSPGPPWLTGVTASAVASDSANPRTVGTVSAMLDFQTKLPTHGLEILRLKLSGDPSFLAKLRITELREILRQNKITGWTKFKKEKIIKELTKLL